MIRPNIQELREAEIINVNLEDHITLDFLIYNIDKNRNLHLKHPNDSNSYYIILGNDKSGYKLYECESKPKLNKKGQIEQIKNRGLKVENININE